MEQIKSEKVNPFDITQADFENVVNKHFLPFLEHCLHRKQGPPVRYNSIMEVTGTLISGHHILLNVIAAMKTQSIPAILLATAMQSLIGVIYVEEFAQRENKPKLWTPGSAF